GELLERELRESGVFVVADPVLDPGALAVTTLEHGDVLVGLVGEDRLEAVAVVVGERQLRAGMRALTPNDQPGTFGPACELEAVGDLDHLAVLTVGAVLVERRNPSLLWGLEDRLADGVGEVVAEREPHPSFSAVVGQLG